MIAKTMDQLLQRKHFDINPFFDPAETVEAMRQQAEKIIDKILKNSLSVTIKK